MGDDNQVNGNDTSQKRSSKQNCCVVHCSNTYNSTTPAVKFYAFPNHWKDAEKKAKWVSAVKRKNEDGTPWQPSKYSRICSEHFVGGSKSEHPLHPAYYPTIFPNAYKKKPNTDGDGKRFLRKMHRNKRCATSSVTSSEDVALHIEPDEPVAMDFSCQTTFEDECDFFEFAVAHNGNEVGTTAKIPKQANLTKQVSDKCCGPNSAEERHVLECSGFHGYYSITTEEGLSSLAGVGFTAFMWLLNLLPNKNIVKIRKVDRLLIFLMKMKTGLSYIALGILFGINRTSSKRIFTSTLMLLVQKCQQVVTWPTKSSIIATMPPVFFKHYPNCRVIIDCTEAKIEQPARIDHRVHMYSHYKGGFTIKFLIGIAPNGAITFVSKCYGGRSSDTHITNDCGLLNYLEPGDVVLADKGFPGIKSDNALFVLPPFLNDGHLTEEQVHETYNVASVRIHVERSIQRVKNYNILQKLKSHLLPYVDDIVFMSCVLANLQPPIIKQDENM